MSNMSYCRFENTARDLEDCWENFEDDLSGREASGRQRIIDLACKIVEQYKNTEERGRLLCGNQ